ncbi:MAG: DNA recombination/repair protein RecA, partial [Gemmatimonadales bacterium]
SVRLDVRRIETLKDGGDAVGNRTRVKVVKNKVAPPFKQAEFDIMYAEGISHTSLLVDIGSESGIIEKSGAWYSYNGQRIGQGRENAKMFLKDNENMMLEIEEKVKVVLGIKNTEAQLEEAESDD